MVGADRRAEAGAARPRVPGCWPTYGQAGRSSFGGQFL
jgi:hypothetical protein